MELKECLFCGNTATEGGTMKFFYLIVAIVAVACGYYYKGKEDLQ